MYHPGSYLVYPTPIHLHSFPQHILSQQEAALRPLSSPSFGLRETATAAPEEDRSPAETSSPHLRHNGSRRSPPQPSTVSSRDLKFGMDRILSGEVSPPSQKESPPLLRASDGEGASSHAGELSMNDSDGPGARMDSPPSSRHPSSPPSPCSPPTALLRCAGDYPYRQGSPPPHAFAPSRPPHLEPSSMGCGRPSYAAAAAAAAAAYSSYYPQFHQHHPGILPYASIYTSSGGMLGPHLEDVASGVAGAMGAACIPVSSSGGSGNVGGGGVSGGGKRKRSWSRAVFSNLQRKGLEKRFQLQKYITKPDRRQLAATLGLTDAQVKVWFQNRRMKWRHSKEGKQPIADPPVSLPNPTPSASHQIHFPQEEEKMEQSPAALTDCTFNPDWEHQEMESTERPDSTQKEMEEEIHVDS